MTIIDEVQFKKTGGLIPVIAQDFRTNEVLMLAYMNKDALEKTLSTGKVHYWSRSRQSLWLKGEVSGHVQILKEVYIDCDGDTLLVKVDQIGGAACHKGYRTCFFRKIEDGRATTVLERVFDPEEKYGKKKA